MAGRRGAGVIKKGGRKKEKTMTKISQVSEKSEEKSTRDIRLQKERRDRKQKTLRRKSKNGLTFWEAWEQRISGEEKRGYSQLNSYGKNLM